MSLTVFKGSIKTGTIAATFMSDFSNVDSDLIVESYTEVPGGNPQSDHAAIAPGGSGTVSITAQKRGVLEVWVVPGHDQESGRLRVSRDGATQDDEAVQGAVRWVYAVEVA